MTSLKVFTFYSFLLPCFRSSSLPVKCRQCLEGWRKQGRVSSSLELWWLWMFIKLTSPWGAGWPWWSTFPEHRSLLLLIILLAHVLSSKKNKGRVGLCICFYFLPAPWQHLLEKKCSAAKRFTAKAFCTPGINSWQPNCTHQGDLVTTVIQEGMWPSAPG